MRGSCGCGSVTYELLRRPIFTYACHCKNCRTQTGGPFVLNAILETESLKLISGDLQPFKMATGSRLGQTVFRCSNCYVATWGHYAPAFEEMYDREKYWPAEALMRRARVIEAKN